MRLNSSISWTDGLLVLHCCVVNSFIGFLSHGSVARLIAVWQRERVYMGSRSLWRTVVCSFLNKKKCFALVMGEGGLFVLLGPQYPKNLTVRLSFRALTNEVKRTLDLPRHGAARALPLFVIVNNVSCGSVRRERGGDRCNLGQSRT